MPLLYHKTVYNHLALPVYYHTTLYSGRQPLRFYGHFLVRQTTHSTWVIRPKLTVEEDTNLRKQLREAGVVYKVYKNTMINFAVKGTEFEELSKHLEGPTAIAISKEDATAPARILYNFSKTAPKLELKAGVVDGTYYDENGIKVIATIPSREELLSKFLGSIQSPIANFARVIKQIAEK